MKNNITTKLPLTSEQIEQYYATINLYHFDIILKDCTELSAKQIINYIANINMQNCHLILDDAPDEYVTELVYDVSQMKEDLLQKQLSLRDLSLFSSADLKDLVEAAKKKSDRSLKDRQELGTFRYALKLSLLEEKQSSLLVRKTLFDQIQPLETDKPFVELKKKDSRKC